MPKKAKAKLPAQPDPDDRPNLPPGAAELSRRITEGLIEAQKKQKAPPGMAKCPECGAIIEPTRTRKVRTHDNPVTGTSCPASKQPMPQGQRPPRPAKKRR